MRWLDVEQDLRYATRSLRRSPGFAIVAVLTLAFGIGATTAIYSVVDTILLQPLPFAGADGLVQIAENVPSSVPGRPPFQRAVTYQEFLEWRARSTTLADAFALSTGENVVRTREGMARLWGATLSANTFTVLGAGAQLGRTLVADDAANPNVVVLSFDTWRRLFDSDPAAVGATIEFRADFNASLTPELVPPRLMTIVGVMPAAFELPSGPMDYYTPLVVDGSKRSPGVTLFGRLRPGVSLTAALEEANVVGSAIVPAPANAPALNVPRFEVRGVKERMVQGLRPALRVLFAAVAAVLLIVCANVANLLLARGTTRQREIAVRMAIGASRTRIARQVLAECVVLAAAGGVLGAAVGAAGVTLVKSLTAVDAPGIFRLGFGTSILPRGHEVGVDPRLFAIAFGIAAITSVAGGVLPALHMSRTSSSRDGIAGHQFGPPGTEDSCGPDRRATGDGHRAARQRRAADQQLRQAVGRGTSSAPWRRSPRTCRRAARRRSIPWSPYGVSRAV